MIMVTVLDPKYTLTIYIFTFSKDIVPDVYERTQDNVIHTSSTVITVAQTSNGWTSHVTVSQCESYIIAYYSTNEGKCIFILHIRLLPEHHTGVYITTVITKAVPERHVLQIHPLAKVIHLTCFRPKGSFMSTLSRQLKSLNKQELSECRAE